MGANLVPRFPLPAGMAPQYHHPPDTLATCQLAFSGKLESEWSTFLLGGKKKKEEGCKKPREPPLAPDMQTKLAAWKEAEKEWKLGCVRQSREGPEMALFLSAWWRSHQAERQDGENHEGTAW